MIGTGSVTYIHTYLLDISSQLACIKLGSREVYHPEVLVGSYKPAGWSSGFIHASC